MVARTFLFFSFDLMSEDFSDLEMSLGEIRVEEIRDLGFWVGHFSQTFSCLNYIHVTFINVFCRSTLAKLIHVRARVNHAVYSSNSGVKLVQN